MRGRSDGGVKVIATGTPEEVAKVKKVVRRPDSQGGELSWE